MKKYLVEFIGTFFLVFTIAFTGNPLAIAAMLIAMIYMGGYISGAHYNPAVTFAVLIRGKINWLDAFVYWIIQILGSAAAAGVYTFITGEVFAPAPSTLASFQTATLMEFFITFALATVVLHVATSDETAGNNYYGLAIGLVILAGAFAGGLSGGVYNPAVALGAYIADMANMNIHAQNVLIYLIGPLTGGLLAGIIYRFLFMTSSAPSRDNSREKNRK